MYQSSLSIFLWEIKSCIVCYSGTVTLWSPKVKNPLVKMLCHRSGVRSMAIDKTGQ